MSARRRSLKLKKPSADARLSENVYETLLRAILTNRILPGESIGEQALAKQLGVSRTPVHDAVRQLIADGLVTQRPNHRPVVATVTANDIEEIFDMRALLEGEAAFLAARRIDRTLLDELSAVGDALADVSDNRAFVQRWADFDEDFHSQIGLAGGNRRLSRDISRYRRLLRGLNRQHTDMAVLQPALSQHQQILDALSRRAADEARQAMLVHVREWKAFFLRKYF
jgi:DNA-binding GntR family transcriptional regulator